MSQWFAPIGVSGYFEDFAGGVVSLSAVLYFVSLAGVSLYLNVLVLDSRHWPHRVDGLPMWGHHALRVAALAVAVIAFNAVVGRGDTRIDVTAERLHSLSSETRGLIAEIPEDRPVFVQAYVSSEVPERYVQARENLIGLLREIDAIAGGRVQVLLEETEPFTPEARDAREKFGIVPRQIPTLTSARTSVMDVFLGVAVTSGAREQVIPFLDRGLSPEYELTRSIRVVAQTERRMVGIVDTDLRILGGLDFATMQNSAEWSVVAELRKQYDVVTVTPDGPIDQDLDALLVILPSSLTQEEMDHVQATIETGKPSLLLVDPSQWSISRWRHPSKAQTPTRCSETPVHHRKKKGTSRRSWPISASIGTRPRSCGIRTTRIRILPIWRRKSFLSALGTRTRTLLTANTRQARLFRNWCCSTPDTSKRHRIRMPISNHWWDRASSRDRFPTFN